MDFKLEESHYLLDRLRSRSFPFISPKLILHNSAKSDDLQLKAGPKMSAKQYQTPNASQIKHLY